MILWIDKIIEFLKQVLCLIITKEFPAKMNLFHDKNIQWYIN